MSEPCEACGGEGQHRRGGGACLERQVAALRADAGAQWARGLNEGLATGNARAERAEARVGVLWLWLATLIAEAVDGGVTQATLDSAEAALGEPAEGKDSKEEAT